MGLSSEQLFDPEHRQEALKVLDMMTDKAERHLLEALKYVKSLPRWQHGIDSVYLSADVRDPHAGG